MFALTSVLEQQKEAAALLHAIEGGQCPAVLSGLSGVHRAHLGAMLQEKTGRPVVFLCADDGEATRLKGDLELFSGVTPAHLSSREFVFYDAAVASRQWEQRRLRTLADLCTGPVPFLVMRRMPHQ